MTSPVQSVRALAESAAATARDSLRHPMLYSILVAVAGRRVGFDVVGFQFGFHELRRSRLFGDRLKSCWINVKMNPLSFAAGPSGTYGREQFAQFASIPGLEFPPHPLDLNLLRLEPEDVVRQVADWPESASTEGRRLEMSLTWHEGRLAWRTSNEAPAVGCRTLVVDAGDGRVLYEHVERYAGQR